MAFKGITFDVGVVTFSGTDGDGFPIVQHDAYGDEWSDSMPLRHTYGFASRPRDPEIDEDTKQPIGGQSCGVLVMRDGTDAHALLLEDPRYVNPVPLLDKGGSVQYAVTDELEPSYYLIYAKDGTHQAYIPVGTDKAHQVTWGQDGSGKPTMEMIHADGQAIVMFDGKTILSSPNGRVFVQISDDGVLVNGNMQVYGGVSTGGPTAQSLLMGDALAAQAEAIVGALLPLFTPSPLASAGPAPFLAAVSAVRAILVAASTKTTKGF